MKRILLTLLLLSTAVSEAAPLVISNLRASQTAGTQLVDVYSEYANKEAAMKPATPKTERPPSTLPVRGTQTGQFRKMVFGGSHSLEGSP